MKKYFGLLILSILGSDLYAYEISEFEIDTINYAHIYLNDSLISQESIIECSIEEFSENDTLKINYFVCSPFEPDLYHAGLFSLKNDNKFLFDLREKIGTYNIYTEKSLNPFIIKIAIADLLRLKNKGVKGIQLFMLNNKNEFSGIICLIGFEKGILTEFQLRPDK